MKNADTPRGRTAAWSDPDTMPAVTVETMLAETVRVGANPPQVLTGHLAGVDREGRVLFEAESVAGPAVPVSIGLAITDGALVKAARSGQRALVIRTDDATPRLVLIGLVRERVAARARDAGPGQLEVEVGGETVSLAADQQIELRCGRASLVLQRNGRVVLKGTEILSASRGSNRIKGASIALN